MRETVRGISLILHMVNSDPLNGVLGVRWIWIIVVVDTVSVCRIPMSETLATDKSPQKNRSR